jgi:fatty acid desaturase
MLPSLVIDGREYDVTEFEKVHPGGSVIRFNYGQDATDAFMNFHHNSERALRVLRSLPNKIKDSTIIDKEFRDWRQSLVDRGFFEGSGIHVVRRLLEPFVLYSLGLFCMYANPGMFGISLALALFALANVRMGWVQHEGGHSSLTTNIKIDRFIQALMIGFGLSSCAWQWSRMHNRHHTAPQKIKHDMDLDTLPLVSFHKSCVEKSKRRTFPLWLRFQAFTFIPVTCGLFLWTYWVYFLHLRAAIKHDRTSLAFMVTSHVVKPLIFVYFAGTTFAQGYLLFMATYVFTAMFLFGHFSLSHSFMPVVDEGDHKSWYDYALEHSVDIAPGNKIIDYFMGFLNYQVIHHMFPTMPQFRHPLVSLELEELCKRTGKTYHRMGYWSAWSSMFANLDRVGCKHKD